MSTKNILFIRWQGAMGHVTRDVAIVKALRNVMPDVRVDWVAHPLAAKVIREAGEKLLPETDQVGDYNQAVMKILSEFGVDLIKYIKEMRKMYSVNIHLLKQLLAKYSFDLIIGDEAYETMFAIATGHLRLNCPFVMIEDFIGVETLKGSGLAMKFGAYLSNRRIVQALKKGQSKITHFFVGEPEDVRDKRFGFLLPNRLKMARRYYHFLGYIVRFDPAEYADQNSVRKKLGYGHEPLIICATGGLGVGAELLELCGKAYPLVKKEIPDLRMVAVHGDLMGLKPPELPPEIEVHQYLPKIYEHYAACDLAVVVGGGTTSIELTALRKPFLFFPLENQFDQQLYVAERIQRHGAGIRMAYRQTSPQSLAKAIVENIGKKMETKPILFEGAQKAVQIIQQLLGVEQTSRSFAILPKQETI